MSRLPAATTTTNKNIFYARHFVEASNPWEKLWIKCPFFEYSRGCICFFIRLLGKALRRCLAKHLCDGGGGVFPPWIFLTMHIWASKIYDIRVRNGVSRSTGQADLLGSAFEYIAPGRSTRKSKRFTILFSWRVIGGVRHLSLHVPPPPLPRYRPLLPTTPSAVI